MIPVGSCCRRPPVSPSQRFCCGTAHGGSRYCRRKKKKEDRVPPMEAARHHDLSGERKRRRNSTTEWLGLSPRIWHPITISHCGISAKRCFFWLGLLLHEGYKHTNSSNLESQGRSRPLIRSAAHRSQKRKVISIMSNGDIRKICSLIDKHRCTSLPGRSSGEP